MSALFRQAGLGDGGYVVVFTCENPRADYLLMNKIDQGSGQVALRARKIEDGDPIPADLVLKMPLRDEPETIPAPGSRLQQHLEEWDRNFSGALATQPRRNGGTPFLDLYRTTNIVRSTVPVTLWEFCGGGSLASLLASCAAGKVDVPAAMGAILVVDVLRALLTTLANISRRISARDQDHPQQTVMIRHREITPGNVFVDVGEYVNPRCPYGFGMAAEWDLPRCMLGDFGKAAAVTTPEQRIAVFRKDARQLRNVLAGLGAADSHRRTPVRRRPDPYGVRAAEAAAAPRPPAAEPARWTRMNAEMDACCAGLDKLDGPGAGAAGDADLAAVLEGTLRTFRALEKEALGDTSAEHDAFLARFRDKVRQHWLRQRPHPLGFDSAEKADAYCAEELGLKPCTWKASLLVDGKIQIPK